MLKFLDSKKTEHFILGTNIVCGIVVVIIVAITFLMGNYESTIFTKSNNVNNYSTALLTDKDVEIDTVSLPLTYKYKKGESVYFDVNLPESIPDNYGIMINSNYSTIRIWVDDELIGSYSEKTPLPFGRLVGNIRVIAPLSAEHSGKIARVEYICFYSGNLTINKISVGNIDGMKMNILRSNIWRLVICIAMIVLGILCFGISISHHFAVNPTNNWAFYHLGCFALYIQLWLFCSSDLPQFVTNANETISLLSYISLAMLPIHFAAFCTEIFWGTRVRFSVIQILCWAYLLVMLLGFVTNLFDPPEILIANHLLIVATMVVSIVTSLSRSKENNTDRNASAFTKAIILLVEIVAVALILFYIYPTSGIDGYILGIGIVVFAFYLFAIILNVELRYISQLQKNEVYKEIAYLDMMTDVKNRRAFNERLTSMDSNSNDEKLLFDLIVFDVDRLKQVNDKLGHSKGDALIIGAAKCITRAFGSIGDIYRIGGDEFAVVVENNHTETVKCLDRLDAEIISFNSGNSDFVLSIARGLATGSKVDSKNDVLSSYLFRTADKRMYKDKMMRHRILDKNEED